MSKLCPIPDWTEINPPPPPYPFVLRRSYPNGLHVFILACENDGKLHVLSSIDHGTSRGSKFSEGSPPPGDDIGSFILGICDRWDKSEAAKTSLWRRKKHRYYYTKTAGGIGGPVYRSELYELLEKGEINWNAQAWEDIPDVPYDGVTTEWRPIRWILGIP